jgi:hypothetical protein
MSKRYITGTKRLLILDGHSSYLTIDFNIFYKKHIIIYLCTSTHASQLLQPLDVGVFGPLKRAYGKLRKGRMEADNNYINKKDFLSLYPNTREKAFTMENIHKGFAGAGLKPLNREWGLLFKSVHQHHQV